MSNLKSRIKDLNEKFGGFIKPLNLSAKKKELKKLEKKSSDPDFWNDQEKARGIMQKIGDLQSELEEISEFEENLKTLVELSKEGELSDDLVKDIVALEKKLTKLEIASFLSGPYDNKNAIISIHAGQGGTEAMDWTSMLFRMYVRFAENNKNWKLDIIDESPGEEAGLKSIIFKVTGSYAFGNLKREAGAHRLVRQSPFNADKLRQTSFALVEVLPELDDLSEEGIELKDEDLDIQFFRSSGSGGQNVNKVSTAVRLTHKPTGIVVSAQTERKQEQNRQMAEKLLIAKLWAKSQEERQKEKKDIQGDYTPATWGTQIRSYVLHPYKMVKDLRTNVETNNAESVLDGNLADFINAEIKLSN